MGEEETRKGRRRTGAWKMEDSEKDGGEPVHKQGERRGERKAVILELETTAAVDGGGG